MSGQREWSTMGRSRRKSSVTDDYGLWVAETTDWVQGLLRRKFARGLFEGIQSGARLVELLCAIDKDFRPSYTPGADPQSFKARDNASVFLAQCAALGIPKIQLFEPSDLVDRKHDRRVISTLLDLARVAHARFGVTPPDIIQYEIEIEQEEIAQRKREQEAASAKRAAAKEAAAREAAAKEAAAKEAAAAEAEAEAEAAAQSAPQDTGSDGESASSDQPALDPETEQKLAAAMELLRARRDSESEANQPPPAAAASDSDSSEYEDYEGDMEDMIDRAVMERLNEIRPKHVSVYKVRSGTYQIGDGPHTYLRLVRGSLLGRVGGGWSDFAVVLRHKISLRKRASKRRL